MGRGCGEMGGQRSELEEKGRFSELSEREDSLHRGDPGRGPCLLGLGEGGQFKNKGYKVRTTKLPVPPLATEIPCS